MRTSFAAIAVVCFGFSLSALAVPPTATAYRTVGAIALDGNLNEPSWQFANSVMVSNMKTWNGGAAAQATTVKVLWDNTYLYLGYTCQDSDVYSTIAGRDKSTWNQDVVEFFMMTQPTDNKAYVEWEFTPSGAMWDGKMTDIKTPAPETAQLWNSAAAQTTASVTGTRNNRTDTDTGWSVEAAIPWADIYNGVAGSHPVDGTQIVMNVNRIDYTTPTNLGTQTQQDNGDIGGGNVQLLSWSQLPAGAFHNPPYFGTVTFSAAPVPEPCTLATLALGALVVRLRRSRP